MGTWPTRASDLAREQELTDRDSTTGMIGQANLPKGSEEEGQTPVVEKARAASTKPGGCKQYFRSRSAKNQGPLAGVTPTAPHLLTRPEPWACGRPLLV